MLEISSQLCNYIFIWIGFAKDKDIKTLTAALDSQYADWMMIHVRREKD
ncbi:MAG: hypothetical protein WCA39_07120 [Nitrososphaeraceae archaeon]